MIKYIIMLVIFFGPTHYQYIRDYNGLIINVYIDYKFRVNDLVEINDAIVQWNYALNSQMIMVVKSYRSGFNVEEVKDIYENHGLMIRRVNSRHKEIPRSEINGYGAIAWTDRLRGHEINVVRDMLGDSDIYYIMLHELGHYLGAEHIEESGLMNRIYTEDNYECIDRNAIGQVIEYNDLNMRWARYCIKE